MEGHAWNTRSATVEEARPVPAGGSRLHRRGRIRGEDTDLIALGVLADGEVAHAGDRHLALQDLAARGFDLRGGVFDRLDGHRDPGPWGIFPTLHQGTVDAGLRVAGSRQPVVRRRTGVPLNGPAEGGRVELFRAIRVVHRNFEVGRPVSHALPPPIECPYTLARRPAQGE